MKSKILMFSIMPFLLVSCSQTGGATGVSDAPISEDEPVPQLSEDGKTITYGEYPNAEEYDVFNIVPELDKLKGKEDKLGFVTYNNARYFNGEFAVNRLKNKGVDYTKCITSLNKWYKCKPLVWDVLAKEGDQYLVWCHEIIDGIVYSYEQGNKTTDYFGNKVPSDVEKNNYQFSNVRDFLNVDFLNMAFPTGHGYIQRKLVDNSINQSIDKDDLERSQKAEKFCCNDTNDKVFMLSSIDLINSKYGFSSSFDFYEKTSDSSRKRDYSEYASRTGIYKAGYSDAAYYLTRTPNVNSAYIYQVSPTGNLGTAAIYSGINGIVPAMYVTIPSK